MRSPDTTRFVVDHMMVKLGKYLRILGYDAIWDAGLRTHELIDMANLGERWFVTRDRHLADRYPRVRCGAVLASDDPVRQLGELVVQLELDVSSGLFSKCIRCNVMLEAVPKKDDVRAAVHPNVFSKYQRFYRCPTCRTVFWKGTHVRNTLAKLCGVVGAAPADV